ncbi:unnamed protein product [Closterium sp. NIES-54]
MPDIVLLGTRTAGFIFADSSRRSSRCCSLSCCCCCCCICSFSSSSSHCRVRASWSGCSFCSSPTPACCRRASLSSSSSSCSTSSANETLYSHSLLRSSSKLASTSGSNIESSPPHSPAPAGSLLLSLPSSAACPPLPNSPNLLSVSPMCSGWTAKPVFTVSTSTVSQESLSTTLSGLSVRSVS